MSTKPPAPTESSEAVPTTVRLEPTVIAKLERIRKATSLTKGALMKLAVNAFCDHVERTGKLPAAAARRSLKAAK